MITHTIRDRDSNLKEVQLTARAAIMAHCQECMGYVNTEVRRCTDPNCCLFLFRLADTVPQEMRKKRRK
jgi:hypothetical protein